MIRCLYIAVFLICASCLVTPAHADTKIEKIHKLLEVTGASARMDQVMDMLWPKIIDIIQKANPSINKSVLDGMSSIGHEEFRNELPLMVSELEKIYDLNLSLEEVDALLAFYQSPIGKSAMAKMPAIITQSMTIGQSWGGQIGQKILDRMTKELRKKGYDVHI